AIQICSAIEQAHKNHIIHRDIKPHNILMTREGIIKVTDFGIARAVSSSTITMVGSTIGSVHYFSPEQARGGFTDEKSDLYSLGITIYEMVTGKLPFDGDSPVAVALKHIQNKAERPQDINPRIPAGINDIIMKAIKKDQNHRYQSASELLADLQRVVKDPDLVPKKNGVGKEEEFPTKKMITLDKMKYDKDDISPEDDEEEMPRKRKDRLSIWLGIITGIIIVSIFTYIGYKIVIPTLMPKNNEFIVSDYVRDDFTMTQEELKKSNIIAVEGKHVFSDSFDKGQIISQSIAPNMTLKPGSTIKFEISDGPEMVTIPDVSKGELRVAEQNLKDLKLQTAVETEYSEEIATGLVIRTDPGALEQVKPGTVVTLYESLGPELKQVTVPNFVGLHRADAEKLIQDNNLAIGKTTPSDIVSDTASIVSQYPLANTIVDEGTAVELTYSEDADQQNTTQTGDTRKISDGYLQWEVVLDDPDKYGDEILVYIVATPAGSDTKVIFNRKVAKSDFPLPLNIPVSSKGSTHVEVKFDGDRVSEADV
ncbi:MAG: PASTA domain-containing protein, partial [Ruminiclostridium sp.]|nr:PASTA domain-containing protein [Ruminiclostridium sp.]